MSKEGHGQWNILVAVMIDSGKYFDINTCTISDELSAVQLCQRSPMLSEYIGKWLSKLNQRRERSVTLTNKFRDQGNKHFDEISGKNDLAADYYTNAIFCAPKDSVELALAHANRAECLKTSDRFYEEGYFDCQLALRLGYPKENLPKLFERKLFFANILRNKNEEYSVETYLEMKKMKIQLEHQATNVTKNHCDVNNSDRRRHHCDVEMKGKKQNLIEKSDSSVGRYLVTEDTIKVNELVFCEKAFSFVPAYNYDQMDAISYACQHCAKVNCLPFPCYECARASYCSPVCLTNHEPIHKYECVGNQKNLWIKLGIGHLAFRTCIVGFKEAVQILEKTKASTTVEDVWSTLIGTDHHKEFSYGNVLRLVSLVDKVSVRHVLRYALTAQLMVIYLSEYTDFFSHLPERCAEIMPNVDDWKTLVCAILLRHMAQAYFNGHTQPQLQLLPPSTYKKSYGYGSFGIDLNDLHMVVSSGTSFSAFFPKLSLANHSCDPNIRFSVDGSNLYVHAIRDIGKNEEIFNCYGPHYKLSSKEQRQTQLQTEFFFECKCNRCVSNDTSYSMYYEYYCPNEECGMRVDMGNDIKLRWWYYLGTDYCNRIDEQFKCNKCGERLPINPSMLRTFERAAQGHIDKGYTFYSTDDYAITSNLLDLYFSTSKCMGKYHELKSRLAHTVLGFNILESSEDLFPRLAYITMENYVNRIERYGIYTLEFILVATYALSILKMAKRIERTNTLPQMQRDISKIRKILDIGTIEKSLTILPNAMQMVFKNIIHDLTFRETDVNELLAMERTSLLCGDRFNVSRDKFKLDCDSVSNSEKTVG